MQHIAYADGVGVCRAGEHVTARAGGVEEGELGGFVVEEGGFEFVGVGGGRGDDFDVFAGGVEGFIVEDAVG